MKEINCFQMSLILTAFAGKIRLNVIIKKHNRYIYRLSSAKNPLTTK
jgi:hypothetical protein